MFAHCRHFKWKSGGGKWYSGIVHCLQNVTGICGFLDLDQMKFGRTKSPQQQKHINRWSIHYADCIYIYLVYHNSQFYEQLLEANIFYFVNLLSYFNFSYYSACVLQISLFIWYRIIFSDHVKWCFSAFLCIFFTCLTRATWLSCPFSWHSYYYVPITNSALRCFTGRAEKSTGTAVALGSTVNYQCSVSFRTSWPADVGYFDISSNMQA